MHKKRSQGNIEAMIAVSGTLYRLNANLLRSTVQDWCAKHGEIPDTQIGFYPGRNTLHPPFILRHLNDAAQKRRRGSSRLYTAFIDFKQAYDSIPRSKMWFHLRKNYQIPTHMLSILENLIMLMNTRFRMGINQRLFSHLLV
jgi:hypothetical protein